MIVFTYESACFSSCNQDPSAGGNSTSAKKRKIGRVERGNLHVCSLVHDTEVVEVVVEVAVIVVVVVVVVVVVRNCNDSSNRHHQSR